MAVSFDAPLLTFQLTIWGMRGGGVRPPVSAKKKRETAGCGECGQKYAKKSAFSCYGACARNLVPFKLHVQLLTAFNTFIM